MPRQPECERCPYCDQDLDWINGYEEPVKHIMAHIDALRESHPEVHLTAEDEIEELVPEVPR